jgi:exonuclease I
MSDKNTIIQDLEVIHVKLNQLVAAYNELKTLDDTDAHEETLREGFLLKAGKNTEKILKYICKKEGILVTAKPQNGKSVDTRIPMLNDYIFHLKEKKIINEDIHHHLEIIKNGEIVVLTI